MSQAPTEKQISLARLIADKLKIEIPDTVYDDKAACSAFIDANQAQALRPSEKQLNFASKIAERKKIQIPDETLANGRALSRWIDEHKD